MPVQVTYPGVYIEEIPSGSKTLSGVATSITAFLGRAPKGPTDRSPNSPVICNGFDDFERMFGGISYDYPMAYAVKDFFDNGGGQAVIVRLFEPHYASQDQWKKIYNSALMVASAGNNETTPEGMVNAIESAGNPETPDSDPQVASAKSAVARSVQNFASENPGADNAAILAEAVKAVDLAAPVTKARLRLDGLNLALLAAEATSDKVVEAYPEALPTNAAGVKKAAKAMADAGNAVAASYKGTTDLEYAAASGVAKAAQEKADAVRNNINPDATTLLPIANAAKKSIDAAVKSALPGLGQQPTQVLNAATAVSEAAGNQVVSMAEKSMTEGKPAAQATAIAAAQSSLFSHNSAQDVVDSTEKKASQYIANPTYGAAKGLADATGEFTSSDTVEAVKAAVDAVAAFYTGNKAAIQTAAAGKQTSDLIPANWDQQTNRTTSVTDAPLSLDTAALSVDGTTVNSDLWANGLVHLVNAATVAQALGTDPGEALQAALDAVEDIKRQVDTVAGNGPTEVLTAAKAADAKLMTQSLETGMLLIGNADPMKAAGDQVVQAATTAAGTNGATTTTVVEAANNAAADAETTAAAGDPATNSLADAAAVIGAMKAATVTNTEIKEQVVAAAELRQTLDTNATAVEVYEAALDAAGAAKQIAEASKAGSSSAVANAQTTAAAKAETYKVNHAGDAAQRVLTAAQTALANNPMAQPRAISMAAASAVIPRTDTQTPDQIRAASDAVVSAARAEAAKQSGQGKLAADEVAQAAANALMINPGAKPADIAGAASDAVAISVNKALTQAHALITDTDVLVLEAANEGSWGSYLSASVDTEGITAEAAAPYGLSAADMFNLTVDYSPISGAAKRERFINVSINPDAGERRLDRILSNGSTLVRVPNNDSGIGVRLPANTPPAGATAKASVAADSWSLNDMTYMGSASLKTGMYALEKTDLFNLMCIPPDSRSSTAPGWDTSNTVYAQAMSYCAKRRAMLILDPPQKWADNAATGQIQAIKLSDLGNFGPEARNAAVYFPRIVKPDPMLSGHPEVFAASGMIAGIMSRTDVSRGVWKAPAGTEAGLSGIQGLEVKLTDDQNGMLNPYGINCLRTFPVIGSVVWGARTMRGADQLADDYKYVPVRRLTLYIEESLYRGTQWAVFEPNDATLWNELRKSVDGFMADLMRQGAFYSYEVICDKSTTTTRDIDLGIVNVVVAFAPVRPAEFVVLKIQQQAVTV